MVRFDWAHRGLRLCGDDGLAQGDAAVVEWHLLRPEDFEPVGLQTFDRGFQQDAILETSTGQHNFLLSDLLREHGDVLDQPSVESFGNGVHFRAVAQIGQHRVEHRFPIDRLSGFDRIHILCQSIAGEFQRHRRLAFEGVERTQSGQRGNGVEQAADARCARAVGFGTKHRSTCFRFRGRQFEQFNVFV